MPVTFATYAVGMMALSGVPLVFSGFWSKDEILHAASAWPVSKGPFVIGLLGAVLTAFYMTRQMAFVFFGKYRGASESHPTSATAHDNAHASDHTHATPHESPSVMTLPLVVLATCAVLLSVVGTPAWPWFESYLAGHAAHFDLGKLFEPSTLATMGLSTLAVAVGMGLGATVYRGAGVTAEVDPIAKAQPGLSRVLMGKFFIDELYQATVLRLTRVLSWLAHAADRFLWNGIVELFSLLALGLAWVNRSFEQWVVNGVFDEGCKSVRGSARLLSLIQNGHIHRYLRVLAITLTALLLFLAWGCRS
jgi:NADH-quinone oxidoreductase subunit L